GGQTITRHQSMKSLIVGLSHVGKCRLPGWGPRVNCNEWLGTLSDIAQNRSQWRKRIHSLTLSKS
ncbi:polyprotein, partial [Schistosoma japonicum]